MSEFLQSDPHPGERPGEHRDRGVRRSRRLRAGIVAAGVAGSVGLAGVAALATSTGGTQGAVTSGSAADVGGGWSTWRSSLQRPASDDGGRQLGDEVGEGADDGSLQQQQSQQPQQFQQFQQVQPPTTGGGAGGPLAQSSGS